MEAHEAHLSLGFSRQEHWSGLSFPSPMRESENEVAQSCPTLRDPMDCSLPGSSIHGIFPGKSTGVGCHCLLELHYYNHWSYIELYIWSTASSLVIISVEGSVIYLVIQEIIILWNKQNINGILNNISGIKSKYFSHEPPTPVFFFLKIVKTREWVTQSRSLIFHVAQMCYIKRFIRYKNTAFSLNYSTDISLRCCKVSRVLQLCSTAFLIIEISEFNRLIAQLLSFKAYESCQGLDMVNYILQPHWRGTHTQHTSC